MPLSTLGDQTNCGIITFYQHQKNIILQSFPPSLVIFIMKIFFRKKINYWTKMQSQPFKLDILHRLNWIFFLIIRQPKSSRNYFHCTSSFLKEYFRTNFLKQIPHTRLLSFLLVIFLALNNTLPSQTFLQQWHDVHQHAFLEMLFYLFII